MFLKGKTWAALPNLEVARARLLWVICLRTSRLVSYDGALTKRSDRRAEILEWCPEIWILSNTEEED